MKTPSPASPAKPQEIERKFLVLDLPAALLAAHPGELLAQGYLTAGEEDGAPAEVRVRRRGNGTAVLTVKSAGGGISRVEVELPLSAEDFVALWPLTAGRRIEKTRHRLPGPAPGLVIEVDVYAGTLAGLVVAEVEFTDLAAALRFQVPAWFGREVTDDADFRNAALARAGWPPG